MLGSRGDEVPWQGWLVVEYSEECQREKCPVSSEIFLTRAGFTVQLTHKDETVGERDETREQIDSLKLEEKRPATMMCAWLAFSPIGSSGSILTATMLTWRRYDHP
jgi:hypothetical protein